MKEHTTSHKSKGLWLQKAISVWNFHGTSLVGCTTAAVLSWGEFALWRDRLSTPWCQGGEHGGNRGMVVSHWRNDLCSDFHRDISLLPRIGNSLTLSWQCVLTYMIRYMWSGICMYYCIYNIDTCNMYVIMPTCPYSVGFSFHISISC